MPEEEYRWLPKERLLRFEEIAALVRVFASLGVRKVRLTGGEPLLRHELHELVRQLAAIEALDDLALTTNGLLLAEQADALSAAGLKRITVSLDTLRADTFEALTRRSGLERVLAGIDAAT
ncbi:MAG: radical SAM protein, partial [Planctomycetaceae bacterium]|nr:radical SAM protein [Planctomycetaceae bacterium]